MFKKTLIGSALLALTLTACNDPKAANAENFSKGIEAYLATKPAICLSLPRTEVSLRDDSPFKNDNTIVLTKTSTGQSSYRKLSYLTEQGLMEFKEQKIEANNLWNKPIEVEALIYTLTEKGKSYLLYDKEFGSNKLCAGKTVLDKVGTFTEPADEDGMKMSRVHFSVKLQELPEWATKPELEQAYQGWSLDKQDTEQKIDLVLTNEGWQSKKLLRNK